MTAFYGLRDADLTDGSLRARARARDWRHALSLYGPLVPIVFAAGLIVGSWLALLAMVLR